MTVLWQKPSSNLSRVSCKAALCSITAQGPKLSSPALTEVAESYEPLEQLNITVDGTVRCIDRVEDAAITLHTGHAASLGTNSDKKEAETLG